MDKNTHYHKLRSKLVDKHRRIQKDVWDKHGAALTHFIHNTKQLALGGVGTLALLTSPTTPLLPAPTHTVKEVGVDLDKGIFLRSDLSQVVPDEVRPLTPEEEQKATEIITRDLGIPVKAELEGKRLNRSYGYIGAEQHLARYPGDNMSTHFQTSEESSKYYSSGMAPGLGAWGYFVPSNETLNQKYIDREKYYIAVQTFLSEGFESRFAEYRDFYKYRKMLLVNPENGKAIVTVIGDAGPASWTGKHLGGSPEVMKYLERVDGRQKGPVLYFFIDDPEDKIPLGPVEYN